MTYGRGYMGDYAYEKIQADLSRICEREDSINEGWT
jgi:hypothetical protein